MDMDDDDFVFPGFADDMEPPPQVDPELPIPPVKALTDLEIDRWSCWVKPFPLPPHATPTEPVDWSDVSDDMLMKMPPSVIVHMQRTAAQGGLQVVSPRQVPFSTLMGRTMDTKRDICDYVVGSVADPDDDWPTIDGASFDRLLPDQPLPPRGTNVAEREKTRTEPLTSAAHLVRDPILSCLIKGRAVVDVLRRDDVAGDADGTAEVLAYAWGIPTEQLMDLDAFTLGLDGPLLRHALRTDSVFPMVHAPIHQKMSVSVSNSELNRELLPEGSAMDWRRMRVFCEAIFLLTCAVESIPLKAIRCNPPPGDPSAPLCRPNIIGFRPLPCTAWTCEPSSFSIFPIWDKRSGLVRAIPSEVLEAMSDYTKQVRPMSYVMSVGHDSNVRKAYASEIMHAAEETLVTGYSLARITVATGGARGRTAAATVRNVIFEVLENSPMQLRLRLARTLLITREEVKVHLATDVVPDGIIDRISYRLVAIGEPLRVKIAAEAARRCSSLDAWWGDITSQAPERYARMAEGTMGWARVAIWLLFRSPTDKWERLKSATHFSALRAVELGAVRGIGLPPERGSVERVTTAARAYVSGITKAYAGYYSAPYDVGMSIADELESRNLTRSADTMREGAYMWMMRARSLRATNVHAITHGTPNRSPNHLRVKGERFDMTIVPAPYRAFAAWKAHVEQSKIIHKAAKKEILDYKDTRISSLFSKFSYPLAPARSSVVTRYLITPNRLGIDLEKSWGMLAQDVARVLATMDDEDKKVAKMLAETAPVPERKYISITDLNLEIPRLLDDGTAKRYDYWCGHMDCDEMDWMEEVLRQAGTAIEMDIRSRFFMSLAEVRTYMLELDKENEKIMLASLETVG